MMDFSKLKEMSICGIELKQLFIDGVQVWKRIKNWVQFSTEADGKTIYNGGLGYKNNTRLNSSAVDTGETGYVTFGYIPAKANDVIRVKGLTWSSTYNTGCYLHAFNSSFVKEKTLRPSSGTQDIVCSNEDNGVVVFTVQGYFSTCRYIRLSAYGSGADAIITVNEKITI